MQQIKDNIGDTNPQYRPFTLTRPDLEDARKVTKAEGQRLTEKYKIPYFETSARTDTGVNEAFQTLAEAVGEKISARKRAPLDSKQSISSSDSREENRDPGKRRRIIKSILPKVMIIPMRLRLVVLVKFFVRKMLIAHQIPSIQSAL